MTSLPVKAVRHWRKHGSVNTAKAILLRLGLVQRNAETRAHVAPSNYGTIQASEQEIEHDALYAIQVARSYAEQLPNGALGICGKSLVELGPGRNFGAALILRAWGAKEVAVADRFLVRFQADYHAPLYRRIAAILQKQDPALAPEPLYDCAAQDAHLPLYVTALEVPLEELARVALARFDITLSNAVLEHVFDPPRAIQSLAAVSRPGSIGLHQVDFRDHRDFTKPLEYLLPDELSFQQMLKTDHAAFGNRIRPDAMHRMFTDKFDRVQFTPNIWTDERYLQDFIPRLRACRNSPYCDIDVAALRILSGRFCVAKNVPA